MTSDGAGLGLQLARRMARLVGGDGRAVPDAQGHVVVTFPAMPESGWDTTGHGSGPGERDAIR